MYRSFDVLAVSGTDDLRDPARVRKLFYAYHLGTLAVAAASALLGLAGAVLLGVPLWLALPSGWTRLGASGAVFALAASCVALGAVLLKVALESPLYRYARSPREYDFVRARLTKAHLQPGTRRGSSSVRVEGGIEGGGRLV